MKIMLDEKEVAEIIVDHIREKYGLTDDDVTWRWNTEKREGNWHLSVTLDVKPAAKKDPYRVPGR